MVSSTVFELVLAKPAFMVMYMRSRQDRTAEQQKHQTPDESDGQAFGESFCC